MSNETPFLGNSYRYLAIRYGVLGGVIWVIALIVYGVIRYPSAFALSPVESVVYLALFVGLIGGYSWLALRRTQATSPTIDIALRWGGWLGLALGLCWLVELWAGNLADPSAGTTGLLVYRTSILAVPVLTIITALSASRHTGLRQTGIWVGIWSGIISALITFSGLFFIAYSGTLLHDPQTIQQSLSNGVTDIAAYGVADSLVAAINHLWIGPLLGVVFGTLGGWMGAAGSQKNYSTV